MQPAPIQSKQTACMRYPQIEATDVLEITGIVAMKPQGALCCAALLPEPKSVPQPKVTVPRWRSIYEDSGH